MSLPHGRAWVRVGIVFVVVVALDQATKAIIRSSIPRGSSEKFFLGINLLVYCLIRLCRGHFSKTGGMTGLIITSIYWHFVDVVWIILYTLVYLLPSHPPT